VDDHDAIARALDHVGLRELAARPAGELSGGQQQRTFIARAIVNDPDLLVLDEPVAGVDQATRDEFRATLTALVRERGAAVLLVSHELGAVADVLDRVVVLRRRVVFDGAPAELAGRGVSLGVHPEDLPLWLEELA
jgi:zinc transport system ATP-binding protein